MKRIFFKSISLAISLAAICVSSPKADAYDGCGQGCNGHDRFDEWFDGSTLCAWRRTWHAANPLATPLRGYYIPRPPKCCGCYGLGETTGYASCDQRMMPSCMNCGHTEESAGTIYPPDASVALGPAKFARLGKVANELDALGPAASPAHTPAAPNGR